MQLPRPLLDSLVSVKGFNEEAFINVHESGEQVTSVRVNPFKSSMVNPSANAQDQWSISSPSHHSPPDSYRDTIHEKIPWSEFGYYLESRPSFTFDPLFHAGCYYVQEASSMFLEEVLKQTVDLSKPLKVLDLCAAPGGKSTHLLSLISNDSLLVSNEIIKSRAAALNDNIVKWGYSNVLVTNNDPKDFQRLENYFDVIVVDAPCSGSGLFRRDPEAIEEWSLNNVALCCQRQQRILADALPALKPGGILIYSTCSYSKEEDEEICKWITRELIFNNEELIIKPEWGIIKSDSSYRFWPDKVKGEGFFIACFRKKDGDEASRFHLKTKTEKFSKEESAILKSTIKTDGLSFLRGEKAIHAFPETLLPGISYLQTKLRTVNFGIKLGEIIRDKLVPDHALALSSIVSENVQSVELDFEEAIQYLKKKELNISTTKKGWSLVKYQDHPLGWINILPNRINNYYPKELRILKD